MEVRDLLFAFMVLAASGLWIYTYILRRMVQGRDRTIEELRHKIEYYKGYVERLETGLRSWTDRCHDRDKRIAEMVELAQKKY